MGAMAPPDEGFEELDLFNAKSVHGADGTRVRLYLPGLGQALAPGSDDEKEKSGKPRTRPKVNVAVRRSRQKAMMKIAGLAAVCECPGEGAAAGVVAAAECRILQQRLEFMDDLVDMAGDSAQAEELLGAGGDGGEEGFACIILSLSDMAPEALTQLVQAMVLVPSSAIAPGHQMATHQPRKERLGAKTNLNVPGSTYRDRPSDSSSCASDATRSPEVSGSHSPEVSGSGSQAGSSTRTNPVRIDSSKDLAVSTGEKIFKIFKAGPGSKGIKSSSLSNSTNCARGLSNSGSFSALAAITKSMTSCRTDLGGGGPPVSRTSRAPLHAPINRPSRVPPYMPAQPTALKSATSSPFPRNLKPLPTKTVNLGLSHRMREADGSTTCEPPGIPSESYWPAWLRSQAHANAVLPDPASDPASPMKFGSHQSKYDGRPVKSAKPTRNVAHGLNGLAGLALQATNVSSNDPSSSPSRASRCNSSRPGSLSRDVSELEPLPPIRYPKYSLAFGPDTTAAEASALLSSCTSDDLQNLQGFMQTRMPGGQKGAAGGEGVQRSESSFSKMNLGNGRVQFRSTPSSQL